MQIQQPSLLGQVPLNFYTQVLLGFSLDPQNIEAAVKNLTDGIRTLIESFPFLAGRVVLEGNNSTSSGVYRVVAREDVDILKIKDCTSYCVSFADILSAKAPASMLDGNLLAPMKGIPEAHNPASSLPVFLLQLNIVKGGAILCSSCMHQSLDMNGQGQLLSLLAQACNSQQFRNEDIIAGNLDGSTVIPLLGNSEIPLKHENFRCLSRLGLNVPAAEVSSSAPWTYFRFTKASLIKLKTEAMSGANGASDWVSTNDALTAFIWQRVAIARSRRFGPETSMFCDRLVNIRGRLQPPVPAGYMGHMLILDQIALSFGQLAKASLSDLAVQLRRSLNSIDDYHIRSAATVIKNEKDRSTFQYGANAVTGRDLTVSSWAGLNLGSISFGPALGRAAFIRRAIQADCEGLAYFMPATSDGDIDVTISLSKEDYDIIDQDPIWKQFAERLG